GRLARLERLAGPRRWRPARLDRTAAEGRDGARLSRPRLAPGLGVAGAVHSVDPRGRARGYRDGHGHPLRHRRRRADPRPLTGHAARYRTSVRYRAAKTPALRGVSSR